MPHSSSLSKILWIGFFSLTFLTLSPAFAQDSSAQKEEQKDVQEQSVRTPKKTGWRTKLGLGYRTTPIGLALFNDTGYRKQLSTSDNLLLKNTYIEGGAVTMTSPAYFRTGGYLELVPLSVLKLRTNIQAAQFYGTYGFLMVPDDQQNPDWTVDEQQANADRGEGFPGQTFYWQSMATPRIKVGPVAALVDLRYMYVRHNAAGAAYDPSWDTLFKNQDHYFSATPTLGFLPVENDNTYLLTAARYEYVRVFGYDLRSSQVNALVIWGIPKSWIKGHNLSLTGLFGYWLKHPQERTNTTYLAFQIGATFGAQ